MKLWMGNIALEFAQPPLGALEQVAQRLNGMYWKERTLSCSTVLR